MITHSSLQWPLNEFSLIDIEQGNLLTFFGSAVEGEVPD